MAKRARKHSGGLKAPTGWPVKPSDEDLLYTVVDGLERAAASAAVHLDIIAALVNHGPLLITAANTQVVKAFTSQPAELATLCVTLRRFLRAAVKDQAAGAPASDHVSTVQAVEYRITGGRLTVTGHLHDLAILQLVLLVDRVGLSRLRLCRAADCDRLFVKRRKSLYCSPRCQRRTEVRSRVQRERDEDARYREAQARRRRRRQKGA